LRNRECKLDILKIYFKGILLYGTEAWTTTKREDSRIQAMEMKFFRAILNKTNKNMIRNTNIRLELGLDEIKMAFKRAD
jgi:hypothetical protein